MITGGISPRILKDGKTPSERPHITTQKVTFQNVKGNLLYFIWMLVENTFLLLFP